MPEFDVDLWSSCIARGIWRVKCASLPEAPPLAQAKMDLESEVGRLSNYIMKSTRQRVKWVKSQELENIRQALAGELCFSGSNRPDLVQNLLGRLRIIEDLTQKIQSLEQEDYEL